jgi:hypothetical protein
MGSWSIGGGVATSDPSVPPDVAGGDQAAQFIGQGKVTATPLFMASVAATVRNAGFEQPIILPEQHQNKAHQPISTRTAGYLQSMMRGVATGGTAAPRLHDLADVGAKTGTAEEGEHTNGWLTAYNSHISGRSPGGGRQLRCGLGRVRRPPAAERRLTRDGRFRPRHPGAAAVTARNGLRPGPPRCRTAVVRMRCALGTHTVVSHWLVTACRGKRAEVPGSALRVVAVTCETGGGAPETEVP